MSVEEEGGELRQCFKYLAEPNNLVLRFRDESGFVYMVYRTSVHLGEVI